MNDWDTLDACRRVADWLQYDIGTIYIENKRGDKFKIEDLLSPDDFYDLLDVVKEGVDKTICYLEG